MAPPEAAAIVPWQLTGSLIEPQPVKPLPAGHGQRGSGGVDQSRIP